MATKEIEPVELFRNALRWYIAMCDHDDQAEIARKAGVSRQYISHIAAGKRPGTEEVHRKISLAIGFGYEQFLQIGTKLKLAEVPPVGVTALSSESADKEGVISQPAASKDTVACLSEKKVKILNNLPPRPKASSNNALSFLRKADPKTLSESDVSDLLSFSDIDELFDKMPHLIEPPESLEFSLVPKYKAKLSGSHGSLEPSDQIDANLMFRRKFLEDRGHIDKMALFEVTGESMQPFIYHGDVVLADTSIHSADQIVDGKTYAFREDRTVKIKRLSRQGNALIASSENHTMNPPYRIQIEEFQLIGLILWVGHEVR